MIIRKLDQNKRWAPTIEWDFSALEAMDDDFPKIVISVDEVNHLRNDIEHKIMINNKTQKSKTLTINFVRV